MLLKKSFNKITSFFFIVVFSFAAMADQTPQISQQELLGLLAQPEQSSYVVIDVRTPEEFNNGHIKGAINISHNTITDHLASLSGYKNKKVIVHCRSGRRAVSAENALKENGFSNVLHLSGDMNGWVEAKLPIEK